MTGGAIGSRLFLTIATTAGIAAVVVAGVSGQMSAAPVFTADQATAGKAAYAKHCASCHMPDLTGNAEIPALAGTPFIGTWGARSTKELFDYMSAAMPYGGPSLSAESYTSITAYILQVNGGVPGADALSASTSVPIGSVTAAQKHPSS